MFDAEGYSLWFCDYKFNDENQVTFVTMNKVGGFLQRMDLVRKYAFGKMCILGEEPPFKIKGVWLFRGKDIPQMVMEECYDAELYDWKKVDINDDAQKALVNAYFEEPDTIQGDKLLEAKCFKWFAYLYLTRICPSSAVSIASFAVYVVGSSLSSFLEQSWKTRLYFEKHNLSTWKEDVTPLPCIFLFISLWDFSSKGLSTLAVDVSAQVIERYYTKI